MVLSLPASARFPQMQNRARYPGPNSAKLVLALNSPLVRGRYVSDRVGIILPGCLLASVDFVPKVSIT
jgi:hypothetical protein